MAVISEYQKKGIGSKLVAKGLEKAKELGFNSIIVLGYKDYYPKFGFQRASRWDIKCPFEVPDEVFMAIELTEKALNGKPGIVQYPDEFNEVE
jgi:predicted N-acetyltransferase YhbS